MRGEHLSFTNPFMISPRRLLGTGVPDEWMAVRSSRV